MLPNTWHFFLKPSTFQTSCALLHYSVFLSWPRKLLDSPHISQRNWVKRCTIFSHTFPFGNTIDQFIIIDENQKVYRNPMTARGLNKILITIWMSPTSINIDVTCSHSIQYTQAQSFCTRVEDFNYMSIPRLQFRLQRVF